MQRRRLSRARPVEGDRDRPVPVLREHDFSEPTTPVRVNLRKGRKGVFALNDAGFETAIFILDTA